MRCNKLDYKLMVKLFGFSRQSWNNWKKEERPIVKLLESVFTNEEIDQFLETGEISSLDFCEFKEKSTRSKIMQEIESLKKRVSQLEEDK